MKRRTFLQSIIGVVTALFVPKSKAKTQFGQRRPGYREFHSSSKKNDAEVKKLEDNCTHDLGHWDIKQYYQEKIMSKCVYKDNIFLLFEDGDIYKASYPGKPPNSSYLWYIDTIKWAERIKVCEHPDGYKAVFVQWRRNQDARDNEILSRQVVESLYDIE